MKQIFYKYDDMNNTIQENIKAIRLVKSLVREDLFFVNIKFL